MQIIGLAELLITVGADINAKDNNPGFTPLNYAQDGNAGMIEILERYVGKHTTS